MIHIELRTTEQILVGRFPASRIGGRGGRFLMSTTSDPTPECQRCGDIYDLREGCEATPECDSCAHVVLAELRARVQQAEALLERIAKQSVSKPDYWSSCGQCESNTEDAKELLAAWRAPASGKREDGT